MPLPTKEIEKFVKAESLKLTHATHSYGHFRRVAGGAVWFVKVLGGGRREQELAYIAGLLHDIVRPADERVDHAIASAERAGKILADFKVKREDIEPIVDAIRDHRLQPAKWKSPLHQSVYLADKIFEQMGAYLFFRRCMYVAESVTYRDKPMEKAIEEHFVMRMERIKKGDFPARFSGLVGYQWRWLQEAAEALKSRRPWAWEIAKASYDAGKGGGASIEELILTFEPSSPEAARYRKEAVEYLEGRKMKEFEKLI
jgi:hypothetical protein